MVSRRQLLRIVPNEEGLSPRCQLGTRPHCITWSTRSSAEDNGRSSPPAESDFWMWGWQPEIKTGLPAHRDAGEGQSLLMARF